MTLEIPTSQELAEIYDEAFSANLLAIAKSDRLQAGTFSVMMLDWASSYRCLFQQDLDFDQSPVVAAIHQELENVSLQSNHLLNLLANLSSECTLRISEALGVDSSLPAHSKIAEGDLRRRKIMQEIQTLSNVTEMTASHFDVRKRRDGQNIRTSKIRRLAVGELGVAWRMLTGERPRRRTTNEHQPKAGLPYGPFHEFVIHSLTPLVGEVTAVKGIDAVIKSVVHGMENRPKDYWSSIFHI